MCIKKQYLNVLKNLFKRYLFDQQNLVKTLKSLLKYVFKTTGFK